MEVADAYAPLLWSMTRAEGIDARFRVLDCLGVRVEITIPDHGDEIVVVLDGVEHRLQRRLPEPAKEGPTDA